MLMAVVQNCRILYGRRAANIHTYYYYYFLTSVGVPEVGDKN